MPKHCRRFSLLGLATQAARRRRHPPASELNVAASAGAQAMLHGVLQQPGIVLKSSKWITTLQRFARASKTRVPLYKKECHILPWGSPLSLLHFILRRFDTFTLCAENKPALVPDTVSLPHLLQCHTARPLLEPLQLAHANPGVTRNSAHLYQPYPCKPFSIVQHAYPLLPRIPNASIAMRTPF